ncbi:MAG TPA: F-box-like domain-containing protein [Chlamydiales bacterium]|nr:F-box-like domain-containing protein [Chlamydiales bacterium]
MAITVQENLILRKIEDARNTSEVYVKITSCFEPEDLASFAKTCRTWRAIVTDDFWHRAYRVYKPNLMISKISSAVKCEDGLNLFRNPIQIYFKIGAFIHLRDIAALAKSCKMWGIVINNDFWKYLNRVYFPPKTEEQLFPSALLDELVLKTPLRGPAFFKLQLQRSPAASKKYSHARIHNPVNLPPQEHRSRHFHQTTRSNAGLRRLDQVSNSHQSSSGHSTDAVASPSSKTASTVARLQQLRSNQNHSHLESRKSSKEEKFQEEKGESKVEKSQSRRHVSVSAVQERAQSRQQVSIGPVQEQDTVESRVAFGPHLPPTTTTSACCVIL